jgi:hypothetical protein
LFTKFKEFLEGLKVYFLVEFFLKVPQTDVFLDNSIQPRITLSWVGPLSVYSSLNNCFHEILDGYTCFSHSDRIEEFWANTQIRYSETSKMANHQDHLCDSIRHCEHLCDDSQEIVACTMRRMETWRRDWEHNYEKELKLQENKCLG